MKSIALRIVFFAALLAVSSQVCLSQGGTSAAGLGFIPYQPYSGGSFDHVNLTIGNLYGQIPLVSYPQRGKLHLSFSLYMNGIAWTAAPASLPGGGQTTQWEPSGGGAVVAPDNMWSGGYQAYTTPCQGASGYTGFTLIAYNSDGSAHNEVLTANYPHGTPECGDIGFGYTAVTVDGSGISFTPRAVPGGSAQMLVDRNGVQYGGTYNGVGVVEEDPDGNVITFGTDGAYIDSVNRTISTPNASTTNAGSSGCKGSLPFVSAYLWTIPGPNGSLTYKQCYGTVALSTQFDSGGYEYTGSMTVLQSLLLPDGTSWVFTYGPDKSGANYGDLVGITMPTGGTISYTYATVANTFQTGGPTIRSVTSRTVTDATGTHVWSYNWTPKSPLFVVVTDPQLNDTAYGSMTVAGPKTVQYYQGSFSSGTVVKTVTTGYQSVEADANGMVQPVLQMLPTSVTTQWANGETMQVQDTYDGLLGPSAASYGKIIEERTYAYSGPGGGGTPGALIKSVDYTYQAFQNSAYLSANMLDLITSVTTYSGSSSGGTKASSTTITYDSGSRAASHVTTNLTTPPTTGVYGHPTGTSKWLSGGSSPTTSTTWYDSGEPNIFTDARSNAITVTYNPTDPNSYGAFPSQIQDSTPNKNKITYTYNSVGGISSVADPNSATTTYAYDGSGRIASITYPDTCTSSSNKSQLSFAYSTSANSVTTTRSSCTLPQVIETDVDGLGRTIRVKDESVSTNVIETDKTYDSLGRQASVSNPYHSTGESTYGVTTYQYVGDALGRLYKAVHPDGTFVQYNYSGVATERIDEGNGTRNIANISQVDALGTTVANCELTSTTLPEGSTTDAAPSACGLDIAATGFLTSYTYDVLGNMRSVKQGSLPTRSYTYDTLSRMIYSYNPERGTAISGSTPCGAVSSTANLAYCYDANGNITSITHSAPNQTSASVLATTSYTYDQDNRPLTISYADSYNASQYSALFPTPSAYFTYDVPGQEFKLSTPQYLAGRISGSYTVQGNTYISGEAYSYNPVGRIASMSQCTVDDCQINGSLSSGWSYMMNYQWDIAGMVASMQIMDSYNINVTLSYAYNPAQQLTQVGSTLTGTGYPNPLFSQAQYSSLGGLSSAALGASETEQYTYDNRGHVTNISVVGAAGSQTQLYSASIPAYSSGGGTGYAPNGNVLSASDSVNGNWTYQYDDFNRLINAAANSGPSAGLAYQYYLDRFGNRWSGMTNNGSGSKPAQNQTAPNNQMPGFSYDAEGNLTFDGANTYVYDDEDRIIEVVAAGAVQAQYSYDATGKRIHRTTSITGQSAATSEYVYDYAGRHVADMMPDGNIILGEIYAGTQHIATYYGVGHDTYFAHSDWVGTERARSTSTGMPYQSCTSNPFGDDQVCTQTDVSTIHFTGKEYDVESGNSYFGARYYKSTMGRFLTPDPGWAAAMNLVNPQSLNQYAYALNNPVTNTDPTGLDPCQTGDNYSMSVDDSAGYVGVAGDDDSTANCDYSEKFVNNISQALDANGELHTYTGTLYSTMTVDYSTPESYAALMYISPIAQYSSNTVGFLNRPDNGPHYSLRQVCAASALLNNGTDTALDALGMIPGENSLVKGVQLVGNVVSAGIAIFTNSDLDEGVLAGIGLGLQAAEPYTTNLAVKGAEAVPVAGNVLSGIMTAKDLKQMSDYNDDCLAGKN